MLANYFRCGILSLGETVGGRFRPFSFSLIGFPKLQNSCSALSFAGVRGGGSKLGHSCGLVASKEDAGLKPGAYMQTRRDGESKEDAGLKPGATFKPTETQRAKKMLG